LCRTPHYHGPRGWGSDQAASLEPNGITRLVRDIRLWEQSKATA